MNYRSDATIAEAAAEGRGRLDGDLRMLGTRDGLSHALIWVRDKIAQIDGAYAPRIDPRHTRKRADRDRVLRPLKELEARIAKNHAETQEAYSKTTVPDAP